MSERKVTTELAAIQPGLAALASNPAPVGNVAQELGAIRAELRAMAAENEEIGERLGEILGVRQTRDSR